MEPTQYFCLRLSIKRMPDYLPNNGTACDSIVHELCNLLTSKITTRLKPMSYITACKYEQLQLMESQTASFIAFSCKGTEHCETKINLSTCSFQGNINCTKRHFLKMYLSLEKSKNCFGKCGM